MMIHDGAVIARLLRLSDERDEWQRVSMARERAAYERGRARGRWEGIAEAEASMAAAWARIARPIARGVTFAELQRRRGVAA